MKHETYMCDRCGFCLEGLSLINKMIKKINVWYVILGDTIMGLLFVEENLNCEMYAMLDIAIELIMIVHKLEK